MFRCEAHTREHVEFLSTAPSLCSTNGGPPFRKHMEDMPVPCRHSPKPTRPSEASQLLADELLRQWCRKRTTSERCHECRLMHVAAMEMNMEAEWQRRASGKTSAQRCRRERVRGPIMDGATKPTRGPHTMHSDNSGTCDEIMDVEKEHAFGSCCRD